MRMSDAEAVMWAVEKDPALRSDFCNLTLLDAVPEEKRLRATCERALAAIPRLRQRVVSAPLRIVPPEYRDDPDFDIDYHVRRVAVPPPGDHRALLDLCEQIAEAPFDRSRPLWEFTLVEGLAEGRAAFVQKVHHTISDGVGGLRLSLALLDTERDPGRVSPADVPPLDPGSRHPAAVLRDAVADAIGRAGHAAHGLAAGAAGTVTHPTRVPSHAVDAARAVASISRQGLVTDRARSDVMTDRSLRLHLATMALPMPDVKRVARSLGGTVNDVFVTGIAAALGRYHARHGSSVDTLRMAMPVSTRGRDDVAANRFAPARTLVPIQPADDPLTLFATVRERLGAAKHEPALQLVEGLAGLVSALPTALLVAFTRNQARTIDFAASNLRGSPQPLYLAGARIEQNFPFGPRAGTALNVSTLGYCETLGMGFNVDPAAVSDVDGLLVDVELAFDALLGARVG